MMAPAMISTGPQLISESLATRITESDSVGAPPGSVIWRADRDSCIITHIVRPGPARLRSEAGRARAPQPRRRRPAAETWKSAGGNLTRKSAGGVGPSEASVRPEASRQVLALRLISTLALASHEEPVAPGRGAGPARGHFRPSFGDTLANCTRLALDGLQTGI